MSESVSEEGNFLCRGDKEVMSVRLQFWFLQQQQIIQKLVNTKCTIFRSANMAAGKHKILQWEMPSSVTNTGLVTDCGFPKYLGSIMPRNIHKGNVDIRGF